MRTLEYIPASINHAPSVDKYYGVYLTQSPTDNRALICAMQGYPSPKRFYVVNTTQCTKANAWEALRGLGDIPMKLDEFILELFRRNFTVVEFDNRQSLCQWLLRASD